MVMSFELKPTLKTPHVVVDDATGNVLIAGISIPEDPYSFYADFTEELTKLLNASPESLNFEFKLEYYNTSSTLMIRNILSLLAENNHKTKILVKWYYENYDEDMKIAGEEFSSLFEPLDFSLIGINEFS